VGGGGFCFLGFFVVGGVGVVVVGLGFSLWWCCGCGVLWGWGGLLGGLGLVWGWVTSPRSTFSMYLPLSSPRPSRPLSLDIYLHRHSTSPVYSIRGLYCLSVAPLRSPISPLVLVELLRSSTAPPLSLRPTPLPNVANVFYGGNWWSVFQPLGACSSSLRLAS